MKSDSIDVKDLYKELEEKTDIIVLDVRTEKEYNNGHIKGSVLIPLEILEEKIENKIPNKDSHICTVCRSGMRSQMAKNTMEDKGYKNVKNTTGGMLKWEEEKLPIEK